MSHPFQQQAMIQRTRFDAFATAMRDLGGCFQQKQTLFGLHAVDPSHETLLDQRQIVPIGFGGEEGEFETVFALGRTVTARSVATRFAQDGQNIVDKRKVQRSGKVLDSYLCPRRQPRKSCRHHRHAVTRRLHDTEFVDSCHLRVFRAELRLRRHIHQPTVAMASEDDQLRRRITRGQGQHRWLKANSRPFRTRSGGRGWQFAF